MADASKNQSSWCDRLSPRLVRLIARNGRKPMTHRQIVERSGLSNGTVVRLSKLENWDTVTVGARRKFLAACRVSKNNLWRHLQFLRRQFDLNRTHPPFEYTRAFSERWQHSKSENARREFYMGFSELKALKILRDEKK